MEGKTKPTTEKKGAKTIVMNLYTDRGGKTMEARRKQGDGQGKRRLRTKKLKVTRGGGAEAEKRAVR